MYHFQMLLIPVPQAYFKTWKTILLRFIWKGKKPRISLQVLTRDRKQGALRVPDLKNYYIKQLSSRGLSTGQKTIEIKDGRNWNIQLVRQSWRK